MSRLAYLLCVLLVQLVTAGCHVASASQSAPTPTTGASATPSAAIVTAAPSATATPAAAPSPSRVESDNFFSPALGQTMPYFVYLPNGYDSSSPTRYPVLYMLHGSGGSNTEWQGYGLFSTADQLIGSGATAPVIIVLP